MSDLPAVSGKDAVKAFKSLGFIEARTTGSHVILKREGHPFVVSVPVHANKDLKPGTLRGVIRSSGFSHEEFIAALK